MVNFEPLERKEITILLNKKSLEKENLRINPAIKGLIYVHTKYLAQVSSRVTKKWVSNLFYTLIKL